MADDKAPNPNELTFFLDGKEVKASKGETIIQVAQREGVYIPHYCWHPSLTIAGNCRLCLVEMLMPNPKEPGQFLPNPKPVIACQTPVAPGSAVFTGSTLATTCQKGMMEFLLANHPLDCPICDRGGECMLQRYSVEYGVHTSQMVDQKRKFHKPQADPLIDIERNRCIMCTRCVRFCDEIGGEHVMGVFDRGEGNYIGTFGQGPVSNIFSGNVIDLCPVGCLTSKPFRFKARVWELRQVQSTCTECSAGCKVTHWVRNDHLYRTTPPSRKRHEGFTVNEDTEEFICNQGRFGSNFSQCPSRKAENRVREGGAMVSTSYEDAVRRAADGLKSVIARHGKDAVFVAVSPRACNEVGYLAGRFARTVLESNNVDWRGAFASAQAADAVSSALSCADGDLAETPDVIVVINGDITHQSPVLSMRLKAFARTLRKTIILVGQHHDEYLAKASSMRFHVAPGQTAAAVDFLAGLVSSETPVAGLLESGSALFGCPPARIAALHATLRGAGRGLVVHSLDELAGAGTPWEVPSAVGLRLALGDKWGYLPVLRDRNAVGLHHVGAQPSLPAQHAEALLKAWKVKALPTTAGLATADLVAAIDSGRIKAVVALGADALPLASNKPEVMRALGKLDFFVLSDLFDSEISRLASVAFSPRSNLESNGSYADIEGNLARLKSAVAPAGDSHTEGQYLNDLAIAMGVPFEYHSSQDVFAEIIAALAPSSKLTLKGLELAGPENPGYIEDPGGARRRTQEYNPGDYRTDGAHFRGHAMQLSVATGSAPAAPAGTGFALLWGPHVSGRDHITEHATIADTLRPKPFVEMHPRDAEQLGLRDEQFAVMTVGSTRVKVGIRVGRGGPAPGCLYLPAGTHGAFDAATLRGIVRASIEALDEQVPDQGREMVEAGVK